MSSYPSTQQGGTQSPAPQQGQSSPSSTQQQAGTPTPKPIIRDWASI